MQRYLLLAALLTIALCATAQRRVTVVDIDTHLPIEGVSIRTDSSRAVTTNHYGIATVAERFDSITFTHMRYLKDKITYEEMADTMYLVPRNLMLPDVVVTGLNPDLKRAMKKNHERMLEQNALQMGTGGLTFDFANIIDRRSRRDRKHYKKAKKILREWDAK